MQTRHWRWALEESARVDRVRCVVLWLRRRRRLTLVKLAWVERLGHVMLQSRRRHVSLIFVLQLTRLERLWSATLWLWRWRMGLALLKMAGRDGLRVMVL